MRCDELTAIGLTEEQAQAVMGLHEGAINSVKLEAEVDRALSGAKVRDVRAARPFIEMDKLNFEGGKVTGLTEQIRVMRERQGYLFEEERRSKTGMRHGREPKGDKRGEANEALRSAFGRR